MHKVFVSYHHAKDQEYKERLVHMARRQAVFLDRSVNAGDIDDGLTDQQIRKNIRDKHLRDSTVTIVLVGKQTAHRKHVDWEIYSSMYDGKVNKKSGVLAISLPGTSDCAHVSHDGERSCVYPDVTEWESVRSRAEYERRYPYMPARIVDNLLVPDAQISVVPWGRISRSPAKLRWLIDATFRDRADCKYDLSRPMRRVNSSRMNRDAG